MEKVIEAVDLTKKFGTFTAVNKITFDVYAGEIFGFLGANGAGKTTAMKMLIGIWLPTSGDAKVAGFDVYSQNEEIKKNIGYMSQRFSLYEDLTVQENIRFFGGIYGLSEKSIRTKSEALIEKLDLGEHARALVRSLPMGWKQKLAFSIAILHDPRVVFLDEPTGGVDPITRRKFWDLIYEAAHHGVTVFVTTHYMDEAEYCDRISIMVDGSIAALGSPSDLREKFNAKSVDEIFTRLARGAKRSDNTP